MKTRLLVLAVLVLGFATTVLAADDPFVGTWKLNIGKSKLSGLTPPQSNTLVIKAIDNGLEEIADTVNATGQANHSSRSYIADGKDHSVTGSTTVDAYSLKRVDVHTTVYVLKQAAKDVQTWRTVISDDGKTLTRAVIQGTNLGRTIVFDKQ